MITIPLRQLTQAILQPLVLFASAACFTASAPAQHEEPLLAVRLVLDRIECEGVHDVLTEPDIRVGAKLWVYNSSVSSEVKTWWNRRLVPAPAWSVENPFNPVDSVEWIEVQIRTVEVDQSRDDNDRDTSTGNYRIHWPSCEVWYSSPFFEDFKVAECGEIISARVENHDIPFSGASWTISFHFEVDVPSGPAIGRPAPDSARPGSSITLEGFNFRDSDPTGHLAPGSTVLFDGERVPTTFITDRQLVFEVPSDAYCGEHEVQVVNPRVLALGISDGDPLSNIVKFTVDAPCMDAPAMAITGFDNYEASVGSPVGVRGFGFHEDHELQPGSYVRIGGQVVEPYFIRNKELGFIVPAGLPVGKHTVQVVNPGIPGPLGTTIESNLIELAVFDFSDRPLTAIGTTSEGRIRFTFPSESVEDYRLLISGDLENWEPAPFYERETSTTLVDAIAGTGEEIEFFIAPRPEDPRLFFRVQERQ